MVEVMKITGTSFKRYHVHTATLSALNPAEPTTDPYLCQRLLDTSQANLDQSLVGSLFLSPGSWCAQGFVCALQESVSPVLGGTAHEPHHSAIRTYTGLGKQTLGKHKQNLVHTRTLKKGTVTPQETGPDLTVSVQESQGEAWVSGGLLKGGLHSPNTDTQEVRLWKT